MGRGYGIKEHEAICAVDGTQGNVRAIADALFCSRSTVYSLMHRYPRFKRAIRAERQKQKQTPLFRPHEQAIIAILKQHACGRVPVSSRTISIQLLTHYNLHVPARTVRFYLQSLRQKQAVEQLRPRGAYRLAS